MSMIFCDLTQPLRKTLAQVMNKHGLVHTTKLDAELVKSGDGVLRTPKTR